LRAVRALQSADVILFDREVGAGILDFARREARRLLVGPSGAAANTDEQDEIEAMMVALAGAGRRVVHLVGSDEASRARAEAEIAACRVAGIAVEVVPGVLIPPPKPEGGERRERGIRNQPSVISNQ
jgi:uroporphyrin-III C-methyltransferase/precorrin-2 dehydrogenase/sirohydrochlorin ferrochelatase